MVEIPKPLFNSSWTEEKEALCKKMSETTVAYYRALVRDEDTTEVARMRQEATKAFFDVAFPDRTEEIREKSSIRIISSRSYPRFSCRRAHLEVIK